jgi:hypothetical protein
MRYHQATPTQQHNARRWAAGILSSVDSQVLSVLITLQPIYCQAFLLVFHSGALFAPKWTPI